LNPFDHRVQRFLERFGARIRRTDDDGANEVAGQRSIRAGQRERRGDRPRPQADREAADHLAGAESGLEVRRSGMNPLELDWSSGPEPLHHRDE
jgi:hypothetical protein